ncbi:MAG TPA: hypothetical protein PLS69_00875 [Terricaulis sp.]|nr:hypothetical protein [Terricaulis sp.]HRP11304.1 hypothetical protein [Terricaulis sp.]
MISDDDRLKLLRELARKFPGHDVRIDLSAQWEREGVVVAIHLGRDGMFVSLNGCQSQVESAAHALETLEGVFADRIVGVTAYDGDAPVYSGLAPADDPSAGFPRLDKPGGFNMPPIDSIQLQSWSGARDEERAFVGDD